MLANISTIAEIERWAKIHKNQLKQFLQLRRHQGEELTPSDTTLTRILQKLSLIDLQAAFAMFINALLPETVLTAAVDGKAAKQMKDENGDPILMLNVFAQKLKVQDSV